MKDINDIETLKEIWERNRPAIAAQPGFVFMYHFQGVDDPTEIRAITAWKTYEDAVNSHNPTIKEMIKTSAGPYYVSPPTSDIWETDEVDVEVLATQLST